MGRWKEDARGRLLAAALELYGEQGFDRTTVGAIAERAGLTERTFFRHFADKREVLFAGAEILQGRIVAGVAESCGSLAPLDSVCAGLAAGAAFLNDRQYAKQRQLVIAANPELQERELIKLDSLAAATAEALRDCGVDAPAAALAAETGIAVFKVAFERWLDDSNERDLPRVIRESFDELKIATATATTVA